MIWFKKGAKHKVESYFYCVNQFVLWKRYKNETNDVNKNSPFSSIFVIFLIF